MIVDNVPDEVLTAASDDAATRDKQFASTHTELSASLRRLKEECRREIRSALGADMYGRYDKIREEARLRFAELAGETRHTTESLQRTSERRRVISKDAKQALGQLGIDMQKIEQIRKRYTAEARSAVEEAFMAREVAPYVELSPAEDPSRNANQWGSRSAPYQGMWGNSFSDGTRGDRWANHSEDHLSGEINCESALSIYGADDGDYSYANALSEMQFSFQMPAAGLVEVVATFQAIDTPYSGCLWDELGYSDANIQQLSRPYLVTPSFPSPVYRYGTFLDYRRGEHEEGCWSSTISAPASLRWAHLYSLKSYAAGQWIYCGVGVHDYNFIGVNDMSCHTYMRSRWLLTHVSVRSTGTP